MHERVQVVWRPYLDLGDEGQPWVREGRRLFRRIIYIHCQNEILLLQLQMVLRVFGLP